MHSSSSLLALSLLLCSHPSLALPVTQGSRGSPPPWDQYAKMARYITHLSDWGGMATIATRDPIQGKPFANVFSLSDGPVELGSGIPYMFTTPMEMSVIDLAKNPEASITMSLAQSNYCAEHQYDPEDPRCARLILNGKVIEVSGKEAEFAKTALFSRHPAMETWPQEHGWFFAKLDITNILLLDFFGGVINIPIDDYFNANLDE